LCISLGLSKAYKLIGEEAYRDESEQGALSQGRTTCDVQGRGMEGISGDAFVNEPRLAASWKCRCGITMLITGQWESAVLAAGLLMGRTGKGSASPMTDIERGPWRWPPGGGVVEGP
jgi:hypothetical protein